MIDSPYIRPRRLRENSILRESIREVSISKKNLIYPIFVADIEQKNEIQGMPDVFQHPINNIDKEIEKYVMLGLKSFILFGVSAKKDSMVQNAVDENGIIPRAIRSIKKRLGDDVFIITDVCLCSYTESGHCGIVKNNRVDNDVSLEYLSRVALLHARCGADMIAPSDMMDGRIKAIRSYLDTQGFSHIPIMSYAVKYASNLYGPFRHAADSKPNFGDRRGYQMDFHNRKEAIREALLDIEEGADILMVKPAMAYLDILNTLNDICEVPLAVYQVSGEYAMIRYAAMAGAIDEKDVVYELWIAMKRAGANLIITYHAKKALQERWL